MTDILTTIDGSKVPTKPNKKINPYKVTFGGKSAKQQADQMMADFKKMLEQNPEASIAITYSANNDQAMDIMAGYATGECSITGSNQAAVFRLVIEQIKREGLQDKIHILPVSTCEHSGDGGTPKKEYIERDMQNIARHAGAGWIVLGLQNEETAEDSYAIGGGVAKKWEATLKPIVTTAMQQMSAGDFSSDPLLAAAYATGEEEPDALLMKEEEQIDIGETIGSSHAEHVAPSTPLEAVVGESRIKPHPPIDSTFWSEFSAVTKAKSASLPPDKQPRITDNEIVFPTKDCTVTMHKDGGIKAEKSPASQDAITKFSELLIDTVNVARNQGNLPVLRVLTGGSFDEVKKVLENLKNVDGIKLSLSPELYARIKDSPGATEFFREFKDKLQLPVSSLDGVMPPHREVPPRKGSISPSDVEPILPTARDSVRSSSPTLVDLADAGSAVKAIGTIVGQAKEIQKQYADGTEERANLRKFTDELRVIKAEINQNQTISQEQRGKIQKLSQAITSLDKTSPRLPSPSSSLD